MLRAPLVTLVIMASALALEEGARADPRFDPSFEVHLTQPAPQSPTGLTLRYGLEGGLQFSAAVVFVPYDWGVTPGESIPLGTKVAIVQSTETFGLINSACDRTLPPIEFEMLNSSLDRTETVSFRDRENSAGEDVEPDYAHDEDENGLLDAVDRYPDFLSRELGDVKPLVRLAGITPVAGVPMLLQFLVFSPGTRLSLPDNGLAQSIADFPQSGYPLMMVIQDFRNPDSAHRPDPITDYCTPREVSITFVAPQNSLPILVNPQSGQYPFNLILISQRDGDGDGIANSLDTCPLAPNLGDPRIPLDGDEDGDGMDSACDPNDDPFFDEGTKTDQDVDGYLNRQDNCPLVANGQTMVSHGLFVESPANQIDTDFDDIGDLCDPNPTSPDGEAIVAVKSADVIVGDAEGSGGPPKVALCPHCYRPGESLSEADEGGGNTLAVAAGLIGVGAGAAVIVVGGGALYVLRRRRG